MFVSPANTVTRRPKCGFSAVAKKLWKLFCSMKKESSQQHAPVEHAVIDRQVRRADGERDGAQENDAHAA